MIEEIVPGIARWSAYHEGIGATVYSDLVIASGTLIDPMLPEGGVEALAVDAEPSQVVLSNRHHYRASTRFAECYGCPILCHEAGLHHFDGGEHVRAYAPGDRLAEDVLAVELGCICPDEATLLIEAGAGALSFGDGLTRGEDGELAFMPDSLLGEEPAEVKAGLARNLQRMLELDFDALLFAHAEAIPHGGKPALTEFLAST